MVLEQQVDSSRSIKAVPLRGQSISIKKMVPLRDFLYECCIKKEVKKNGPLVNLRVTVEREGECWK